MRSTPFIVKILQKKKWKYIDVFFITIGQISIKHATKASLCEPRYSNFLQLNDHSILKRGYYQHYNYGIILAF